MYMENIYIFFVFYGCVCVCGLKLSYRNYKILILHSGFVRFVKTILKSILES